MNKNEGQPGVRYCKKCKCELTSTNKYKLCEDCRRKSNRIKSGIIKSLLAVGGIALSAVAIVKHNEENKT